MVSEQPGGRSEAKSPKVQSTARKELRYVSLMLTRSPAEAANRWAPNTIERALDKNFELLGMMRVAAAAAVAAAAVEEVAMRVGNADVATAAPTEAATIVDAACPTVHIMGPPKSGGVEGGGSPSPVRAEITVRNGRRGGGDRLAGGDGG